MSYLRILDDVDMDGLKQLANARLIQPAEQAVLHGTCLCVKVTLEGYFYKRSQGIYELRILKSLVRNLVAQATKKFNHHISRKISLLYRTGLGLPLSKECHLLWEVLADGSTPKVDGRLFSYKDMVKVLVAHWKQIAESNIDPFWLYFNPQNNYFKGLLNASYPTVIKKEYLQTKKPLYVFPRYEGFDCSIVYRLDSEGNAKLFAAYARINKKMLNVTAQLASSNSVAKELPANSVPSNFGPFFIVAGVLTINKSSQKFLGKEWEENSVTSLIRSSLEQDIESLATYKDVKIDPRSSSKVFVKKYELLYQKARNYLEDAKSKRLTKKVAIRINKAQILIDRFEEHKTIIDKADQQHKHLRDYDIINHLAFIAFDMYGYKDSKIRKSTNSYSDVHGFLLKIGFVVSKFETTYAKTVNKLQEQVKGVALRNFTHNGIICRVSENGSNHPLTWVKFKF
jgi:hypothetical protein